MNIQAGKKLFTNHDDGEKVSLTCFRNVKDEATEIGSKIENLKRQVESAKANEALIAAQQAASTSSSASNSKLSGAIDSLERLEKRQAAQAAALEAADELAAEESGADLDARLAKLTGNGEKSVDDLLANL